MTETKRGKAHKFLTSHYSDTDNIVIKIQSRVDWSYNYRSEALTQYSFNVRARLATIPFNYTVSKLIRYCVPYKPSQ